MKRFCTLFVLFMAIGVVGFAQRTITGQITDEAGDALIGANVLAKGTSVGTITDIDGKYSLDVPEGINELEVSYTGYETVSVPIEGNEVSVTLAEGISLGEIVVTGQGAGIQKKRLSTTVDYLDEDDINKLAANQIDQLLQSTTPSAQIRLSSGQPGTASIIRTRGPISASTSTTPVIIVDGVRVDNLNSNPELGIGTGGANVSALADIPQESIEKIEYIKGGAATTLYGADAANGVIQIITKKGGSGKAKVYVESRMGIIQATDDYLKFDRTKEAIFEDGVMQEINLGINGGTRDFGYNFSGSLYADDGFNDLNEQTKGSLQFGVSANISDKLRYQGSASYVNFKSNLDYNANTSFSRFSNFEGGARGDLNELSDEDWEIELQRSRDLARTVDITGVTNRITVSNKFTYDILNSLVANATFGIDYRTNTQEESLTNETQIILGSIAEGTTDRASFSRALRTSSTVTADVNFTHNIDVSDFSFVTVLGAQTFRTNDYQNRLNGSGGVDGTRLVETFPTQTISDFVLENANYGLYFLSNIGIYDVAFVELGGRIDDNTSSGDNTSALFLPKVGITYNISDHDFYRKSRLKNVLTGIKLRANYGEATNFARPFSQDRTFALENFLGTPAFRFDQPGNTELVSEIVKTTEFGAELNFFDYRLNASVTRYMGITEDALFTPTQPPSSGLLNQVQNIGEIENTGWEFAIDATVLKKADHNLKVSLSYNTNDNVVKSSGGAAPFNVGGFTVAGAWVEEGQSLGYLRATVAESNGDGTYTFSPNTNLGKTFAPEFGSMTLDYSWKRLNVFATADYQMGGKIVELSFLLRHLRGLDNTGIPEDILGTTSPFNYLNYFTFDNDFLKVRNIGVNYSLGRSIAFVKDVRLGLNFVNPFNWTSSGVDPEVTGSGLGLQNGFSGGGFAYGTESAPRQFILSLRVNL